MKMLVLSLGLLFGLAGLAVAADACCDAGPCCDVPMPCCD